MSNDDKEDRAMAALYVIFGLVGFMLFYVFIKWMQ